MTGFSPTYRDQVFENALLDEARHRHANEFASALASLCLVRATGRIDHPLLDKAIERLDGNVRIERLLLDPGTQNVGDAVLDLASLISITRIERPIFRVRLIGRGVVNEIDMMRLILRVTYEFMINAVKKSDDPSRAIAVRVASKNDSLSLTVVNFIDETRYRTTMPPSGIAVLRRLATACGGRVNGRREGDRYVAQASFPRPDG